MVSDFSTLFCKEHIPTAFSITVFTEMLQKDTGRGVVIVASTYAGDKRVTESATWLKTIWRGEARNEWMVRCEKGNISQVSRLMYAPPLTRTISLHLIPHQTLCLNTHLRPGDNSLTPNMIHWGKSFFSTAKEKNNGKILHSQNKKTSHPLNLISKYLWRKFHSNC